MPPLMSPQMQTEIKLIDKSNREQIQSIREIFFQTTARKSFKDDLERENFFHIWTDYYLMKEHPGKTLIAVSDDEIVGYLSYCTDSVLAKNHFQPNIKSYRVFEKHFRHYPAHLHINLSPKAQGLGIGSQLIDECVRALNRENITGVHIVTSPDSKNVNFYEKNNFLFQEAELFNGSKLLFMGRKL